MSALLTNAQQISQSGATLKGDLLVSTMLNPVSGYCFSGLPPANTSTPTLTLNTASSGTNVAAIANNAPNTANYLFTKSNDYIQPSNTYPYYTLVTEQQPPNSTLGFGGFCVEFESDDPTIMWAYSRNLNGNARMICDGVELFRIEAGVYNGTAQGGSSTTMALPTGANATNHYYESLFFHITGGTGSGQYNQSTGYAVTSQTSTASSIAGTAFTVGGTVTGTFQIGTSLSGTVVTAGTYIVSGTSPNFVVNNSQTVASEAINGSTKIVTFGSNWTTPPDNTSVFEVTETKSLWSNLTNTIYNSYYPTVAWNGERRLRHYRIEGSGVQFGGIYMSSAISTCQPARRTSGGIPCVWIGDSFSAGTGATLGANSLCSVCCEIMGWDLYNLSMGGTGVLTPGSSFTAPQRILPPPNAWFLTLNGASAGTYTLTQNGVTTGTIAYSASQSTIQTALNTAFGNNTFSVIAGSAATQSNIWIMGLGSTASQTLPMTANFSGITAPTTPTISQYLGDLVNKLPPAYVKGKLPFRIVIACGHNDTASTSSSYTPSVITAAYTAFIEALQAQYPLATITVIGNMYLPLPSSDSNVAICNTAILASVTAANLKTPTGNLSFIDSVTTPWFSGTGHLYGGQTGTGNNDVAGWSDGIHPSTYGHAIYGTRQSRAIQALEAS